jgi:GAF domain-containing protein
MTDIALQEEARRVLEIERYQVLDSAPEAGFDRVTRLASEFFGAPVSAISLCDRERLWFKSIVGLDLPECPRTAGICSNVIYSNDPLILHSAAEHPRFRDHPMVCSAPHVRFYAGAPLVTPSGCRIGSLCIADLEARPGFTQAEGGRLKELASLVVDELELRLERQKALSASAAKSAFLAAMSHEIRAPMNGVLGMAELLLGADDLAPRHHRRIETILRSGETLLALLDQIFDLSKIEAGKLELDPKPFDLRELIQDLHALLQPRAQEKDLWFDLQDRLGAIGPVIGDPLRLRQILANLLSNGIKFTKEGGVALRAGARATRRRGRPFARDRGQRDRHRRRRARSRLRAGRALDREPVRRYRARPRDHAATGGDDGRPGRRQEPARQRLDLLSRARAGRGRR